MKKTVLTFDEMTAFVEPLIESKLYVIEVQELDDNAGFSIQWLVHKNYVAFDGESYPDEFWVTEDNRMLLVQDIEPEHCRNILRMILREDRKSLANSMGDLAEQLGQVLSEGGIDSDEMVDVTTPVSRTLH